MVPSAGRNGSQSALELNLRVHAIGAMVVPVVLGCMRACVCAIRAMRAVRAVCTACAVHAVLLVRSWVHAVIPSRSDGSHSHAPLHCQ